MVIDGSQFDCALKFKIFLGHRRAVKLSSTGTSFGAKIIHGKSQLFLKKLVQKVEYRFLSFELKLSASSKSSWTK